LVLFFSDAAQSTKNPISSAASAQMYKMDKLQAAKAQLIKLEVRHKNNVK
jgi:hypothetical protein